jgi:hypothetical protein
MTKRDFSHYSPRAGTDTAKLVDILNRNPEATRDVVVKKAVDAGIDEGKAKSWIRGLIMNGNAPGRLPNGVLNVPNDKAKNQELAGGARAETKTSRAKKAAGGRKGGRAKKAA